MRNDKQYASDRGKLKRPFFSCKGRDLSLLELLDRFVLRTYASKSVLQINELIAKAPNSKSTLNVALEDSRIICFQSFLTLPISIPIRISRKKLGILAFEKSNFTKTRESLNHHSHSETESC